MGGRAKRVPTLRASPPRMEFVSEVRRKIYEARSGVEAERKADAGEDSQVKAV